MNNTINYKKTMEIYDYIINCNSVKELLSMDNMNKYALIEIYCMHKISKKEYNIILKILEEIINDEIINGERNAYSITLSISRVIIELLMLNIKKIDYKIVDIIFRVYNNTNSIMYLALFKHSKIKISDLVNKLLDNNDGYILYKLNSIEFNEDIGFIAPVYFYKKGLVNLDYLLSPKQRFSIKTVIKLIKEGLYYSPILNDRVKIRRIYNYIYTYYKIIVYENEGRGYINNDDINEYINLLKNNILDGKLYLALPNCELVIYQEEKEKEKEKNNRKHNELLNKSLVDIRQFLMKKYNKNYINYKNIRISPYAAICLMKFDKSLNLSHILNTSPLKYINYSEFSFLKKDENKIKFSYLIALFLDDNLMNTVMFYNIVINSLTLINNTKEFMILINRIKISRKISALLLPIILLKAMEMDDFIDYIDYYNDICSKHIRLNNDIIYGDITTNNIKKIISQPNIKMITINGKKNNKVNIEILEQNLEILLFQYKCKGGFVAANIMNIYLIEEFVFTKRNIIRINMRHKLYNLITECEQIIKSHNIKFTINY